MINFPCAKINLGLNITEKRPDGYHNLETVFFPIPLCDALEVQTMHEAFPSKLNCDLKVTGNSVCCNEEAQVKKIFAAMSGVNHPHQKREMKDLIDSVLPTAIPVHVDHDAIAACVYI